MKIPVTTARTFLIDFCILWGLHDLQIIACRLYLDTVRPTAGWLEGQVYRELTLDSLRKFSLKHQRHFATLRTHWDRQDSGRDGVHDPEFENRMRSLKGYCHALGLVERAGELARQYGFSEDQISGKDLRLQPGVLKDFRKAANAGYAYAEAAIRRSDEKIRSRTDSNKNPIVAKRLHAGSFRDGMRPEASLAYAVISFVYMINDIPRRIDQFIASANESALTRPSLTPCKYSDVKCDIEALVDALRAIYLQDSNHLREEATCVALNPGGERLTIEQVRKLLITHQSDRLLEDPVFRNPPLSRKSRKPGTARQAIRDARHVHTSERSLPLDNQDKKFEPLPPDPKLSPALAWRFGCTRAHIPIPDLARPFVPEL